MPEGAPPPGTYLGFDFGLRRTGVAVGESLTGAARPLVTLACRHGQPDWAEVERLLGEWQPKGLVVGIPWRDEGEASTAEAAERFARRLEGRFRLPVHRINEYLSSYAAERELGARGRGGRKLQRGKQEIDRVAAAMILETWLQSL
jgi:putative Holliday junction resolvase